MTELKKENESLKERLLELQEGNEELTKNFKYACEEHNICEKERFNLKKENEELKERLIEKDRIMELIWKSLK